MRESYIEKFFSKKCKEQGMRCIKLLPTFEWGIPDRMSILNGVCGFAELKAPGKKPKPHQEAYLKALEKEGSFVGVVDSKESALEWIESFTNHVKKKTPC